MPHNILYASFQFFSFSLFLLSRSLASDSWRINIPSTASASVMFLPCLVTIFQGITTYLSSVTIHNYITAVGGKSVNGLKIAHFKYKNSDKFPRIIIYGGMKVVQGKFGNYFELDIYDDKTEELFKSLEEALLRAGGSCSDEKPPLICYGGFYTVRCKIYPNSRLSNLKVGRY